MKRSLLILFALVLTAPVLFAQGPPPPPPPPAPAKLNPVSEWQTFSSTEGNFSLLMPKKPMEMKQEVRTEVGKVPIKIFVAQNGMVAYMAMYADYPIIFDTPAAIKSSLDGARDIMLGNRKGQIISEQDISYDKFPGRELKAKTPDGLMNARIFIIHQRAYMMMTMMPIADDKDFPQARDTAQYFGSFKLLKEPEIPANLSSMSKVTSAAEKIDPPPDFFDRPVSWREFSPPESGFKIQLPGEPFHQNTPLDPNNRNLDIHMWMARGDGFVTQVVAQPLVMIPQEVARRNLIFKGLLNGMLNNGNMQLLDEKEISYKGHPGREYRLQMPFGIATGKAYLLNNTIYLLVAFPINGQDKSEDIVRFFDSFKVPAVDDSKLVLGVPPKIVSTTPPPAMPVMKDDSPPPKKINVSGGVLQENALKKVQPAYPPEAKLAGVQGEVKVQVNISEEGKVLDAIVISGPEELRAVSAAAARQWTFKPVELSGMPVRVQGVLTFNFTLR